MGALLPMTGGDAGLVLRAMSGLEELDLFCTLPYSFNDELSDDLAFGRRHPEWMWMALQDGRPLARAAWWAPRPGEAPACLDILDLDDGLPDDRARGLGAKLLQTAMPLVTRSGDAQPEYYRLVPSDWRSDRETARGIQNRMAVIEGAGAHLLVERLDNVPMAEAFRRAGWVNFERTIAMVW